MGILNTDTPPRRERIALRVIQWLAYGGMLLCALIILSSFVWVIAPTPAFIADVADVNGRWSLYFDQERVRRVDETPRYRNPGFNMRDKSSVQWKFNHYFDPWLDAFIVATFALPALPLLGWAIWSAAIFRRNKVLAGAALREDLASSLLSAEEALRTRFAAANGAGLRPFLLTAPVVAALILIDPFCVRVPCVVAPFPFNAPTVLTALEVMRAVEFALLYLYGVLFVILFLDPFLRTGMLVMRCVPKSAPDAEARLAAIASTRTVILAALGAAGLGIFLGGYWIEYDLRVWLVASKRGVGFAAFILKPFRLCNLTLFAGSALVLVLLPRWALRRQWREALENYYRFE